MFTNSISKIFIVLAVLAVALVTISFVNQPASIAASDHSYDIVELMRGQRLNGLHVHHLSMIRLRICVLTVAPAGSQSTPAML